MSTKDGWNLPSTVTKEEFFRLLSQYYEELKHRDTMLWRQMFAYFYLTLIISLFPYTNILGYQHDNYLPTSVFSILGMLLCILFLIVSVAYANRYKYISDIYNGMLKMVPLEVRRSADKGKFLIGKRRVPILKWQMTKTIPVCMFTMLFLLNLALFAMNVLVKYFIPF